MKYSLNNNEILSTLLLNNKDKFIKKINWESTEIPVYDSDGNLVDGAFKTRRLEDVLNFFHSHANLENKIDWNEKDPLKLAIAIDNLISETVKNADEKKQRKTDIKSLFKDTEHFEVLGEDDNYVYVAPLTWDACVFIDSFKCGGQGATWCIGWEDKDIYWKKYTEDDNCVFVLMMKKPSSEEYILERLNYTGDIDLDKIYDIEWGEDDIEDLTEKYPNDNKVMFQIDSSGYVTAWEQSDDFPLFEDARMSGIIKRCELGFDWGDDEYMRISDLIAERRFGDMEGIVDDYGDEVRVNLDTLYSSDVTYQQANDFITERYSDYVPLVTIVGLCEHESMVGDVLSSLDIDSLDFSQMGVKKGYSFDLRRVFRDVYCVTSLIDFSCFDGNYVITDDFLDCLSGEPQTIIVNPNCTVLIDYINEYNEKHGTNIEIKQKYDYTNQPQLDFGE